VAVVLAEPGVGKTRLLEPTRGLTEEAGPRVFVHPELEAAPTGRGCRELRRPGRPLLAGGRTWPITSRWRCWWTTPIGRMQHRCGLSAVWPTRSRGCPWLWWWRPEAASRLRRGPAVGPRAERRASVLEPPYAERPVRRPPRARAARRRDGGACRRSGSRRSRSGPRRGAHRLCRWCGPSAPRRCRAATRRAEID
jgi:hypothetical protein